MKRMFYATLATGEIAVGTWMFSVGLRHTAAELGGSWAALVYGLANAVIFILSIDNLLKALGERR